MEQYEFKECESCASKPGTPILCNGCLHNRNAIYELHTELKEAQKKIEVIDLIINL